MILLLIFLGSIIYTEVRGESIYIGKPIHVEQVSTELIKYDCGFCTKRNPYTPEYDGEYTFGAAQIVKIDLFKTRDFNLNIDTRFFLDTTSMVKYAGLTSAMGFRYKAIEIEKYHLSAHRMDEEELYNMKFPLEDSVLIRFNWIKD